MAFGDDLPDPRVERRTKHHEADVVVVGAGVFGCAVAFALADQGRSVLLLERWMQEPDRIVGELMQPGGCEALRKLGLERCLEGIDAVACHGYHVIHHNDDVVIPYPVLNARGDVVPEARPGGGGRPAAANGYAALPGGGGGGDDKRPEGRGFHHGRFIANLRRACAGHPNISMFETEVTATITGEHSPAVLGVESRTTDRATGEKRPDCFFGKLTIIADGYASRFRKQYVGRAPVVKSRFSALELVDCAFPPQGYGHVVIGRSSLTLLYQIGTRETRALINVPEGHPAAAPGAGGVRNYIRAVVLPDLPEAVRPSVEAALADGKIPRSMPNSWLPPTPQTAHPGVLVLGDAMNMRHPLTGGGMTVALNDVVLLAGLLGPVADLGDADAVRAAARRLHRRRKALTAVVNVLAQALYSLFAADDRRLRALQRGCFAYFERGLVEEPVAMLGGLLHRPATLARHFFAVAFLAIWLDARATLARGPGPLGLLLLPLALADAVLILAKACVVFLPILYREFQ